MKPFLSDKDRANLLAMLDAIGKIQRFTKDLNTPDDFINDEESFDASLMNFVIIGESVARLSEHLKSHYSGIAWQKSKVFGTLLFTTILELMLLKFGKSFRNIFLY